MSLRNNTTRLRRPGCRIAGALRAACSSNISSRSPAPWCAHRWWQRNDDKWLRARWSGVSATRRDGSGFCGVRCRNRPSYAALLRVLRGGGIGGRVACRTGGERCRRLARAYELLIWRLAEAESTRACFVHCAALGRAGRWQGNWGPICGAEGGVRPPTLPNERLRRPRGTHFAAARCSGARERPLSGAQCSSERLLGRYGSSACGGSCLCLWMVEYKRCLLESSTGSEQLHTT